MQGKWLSDVTRRAIKGRRQGRKRGVPDVPGDVLASAEYHATFPVASALKRLCRSGPVPLAVGGGGGLGAVGGRGEEGLRGGRDSDGHVVVVGVVAARNGVEEQFLVVVVVVDANF